jgi:hypothetical protein
VHEELLDATCGDGRFRVDKHLQGKGLRQLFLGRDTTTTGGALLISYDKLPKHMTIEGFVQTTGAHAPGVLDLVFAGPPDDKNLWRYWGVIERPPPGTEWLPSLLGQHPEEVAANAVPQRLPSYDAATALPNALGLGRSAGRILAENAGGGLFRRRGAILAHVRPETMWAERGSNGVLCVRALSQRSELMFAASYVTSFAWPVFDRYYYAPEVDMKGATVDDRALVFCLSIMIAEWATGLYPFAKKDHSMGPIKDDQVALDLPDRLAVLLGSGMRIDVGQRPTLSAFLAELERC